MKHTNSGKVCMPQGKWKDEAETVECLGCKRRFGILLRKHHCRSCGDIFCNKCLPRIVPIENLIAPDKICAACAELFDGIQAVDTSAKLKTAYDMDQIHSLCSSFKPQVMSTSYNVAKVAKLMFDQAEILCPPPFDTFCNTASQVLTLSINSVVNTAEACRLADRISRLSFGVLQLISSPEKFDGANMITEQLISVFEEAIAFLAKFQPESDRSFFETVKHKFRLYSSETVNKFASIHERLTLITQDRNFVASVASEVGNPTLSDVQEGISREVSHVLESIRKADAEERVGLNHIQSQLESMMELFNDSVPLHLRSKNMVVLDPRSVHIETGTILGRGASGCVFAGVLYGSTPVAVKVLLNSPATADVLKKVTEEMEITVRVAHRNVIKVYGLLSSCAEFEGRAAVVMERLGVSLDCADLKKMPYPGKMKLTTDIIAGMARVHDPNDGLVHFDLKPSNIMLTEDGRTAKIVDFGIAQGKTSVAFATVGEVSRAKGTVAYMAPEILLGTSRGFYCDVYSFAVVLYEMWNNKRPWHGFSETAIITAVQQGSRPSTDIEMIRQGVPDSIVALIVACWEQQPGMRPGFHDMLEISKISAFFEAHVSRWPAFLQPFSIERNGSAVHSSSLVTAVPVYNHAMIAGRGATTYTSETSRGLQVLHVGGAAVATFSSEQLCAWLINQNINRDIVEWFLSKAIIGDVFVASGAKIIGSLRKDGTIDEWNVDALERCYEKVHLSVEEEKQRQLQLLAARNEVTENAIQQQLEEERKRKAQEKAEREAAANFAQLQKQQEVERAMAAAEKLLYDKNRDDNLQTLKMWREIWTNKDPSLVEAFYRRHSPDWASSYTVSGNTTYSNDRAKAKLQTYKSLKEDWKLIKSSFKVHNATDKYVQFSYSTLSRTATKWNVAIGFEFNPPGIILRQTTVVNKTD